MREGPEVVQAEECYAYPIKELCGAAYTSQNANYVTLMAPGEERSEAYSFAIRKKTILALAKWLETIG